MNSFHYLVEKCTATFQEFRIKCRQIVRPALQVGPCILPQSVPKFHIPTSGAKVMESNPKMLCVEGELLVHSDLPFDVHIWNKTSARPEEDENHTIIKHNQRMACYLSNSQGRCDSASPSISVTDDEKDNADEEAAVEKEEEEDGNDCEFDPDHWEFVDRKYRIAFLPKVQDIPSPCFGRMDAPKGSFFCKKVHVMDKCEPEAVGRHPQMVDCEEDDLPRQDSSQRSPRCYRRLSSVYLQYGLQQPEAAAQRGEQVRISGTGTRSRSFSLPRGIEPMFRSRKSPNCRRAVLGELKFEIAYLLDERRFMVTLIRCDEVGGTSQDDNESSVYVKLCLMPGKKQVQFSEEIKHTKEPHFFEEFFFDVSLKDLKKMSLRMKIYNNIPVRPNQFIGQIDLTLSKYNLLETNRMWRNLEPRAKEKEDLGHLHVSLQISIVKHHLMITISRATGLSQIHSSGPPNPFVCVEVSQESNHVIEMHTAKIKNSCFPIFKEALLFKLACVDIESLRRTRVLVSVLHRDILRSDPIIGQVRLGNDSTEHTEFLHWQEVLLRPERDIGRWHYLM